MKTKHPIPQVGDYGIRTEPIAMIQQSMFDKMYPQGQFGKVINVEQLYSRTTGKKLPLKITLRVRGREGEKYHTTLPIRSYKQVIIK